LDQASGTRSPLVSDSEYTEIPDEFLIRILGGEKPDASPSRCEITHKNGGLRWGARRISLKPSKRPS